ncbi:helix-turn-helix domain-containing protein [Pseudonocardia acaciae]|uniref:helix-turn-helix domain-containing protein n=1 Tax=Pseudonocardia acaciae TaxID=551276 RepID=UPI00048EA516|nr:helix-turn-helix domain-containing protein [Pseudonocardia acaciae]
MRLLALLAAFERGDDTLGFGELADAAELPPSTAHRLVRDLLGWGALERTSSGRYRIGERLRRLDARSGREPDFGGSRAPSPIRIGTIAGRYRPSDPGWTGKLLLATAPYRPPAPPARSATTYGGGGPPPP